MTTKEYFEKLVNGGVNFNEHVFNRLFEIDANGNIKSIEGVWFQMFGDIPMIVSTNIPRSELEKFTPNEKYKSKPFDDLKPSIENSPFTSKGYPFSKELKNYSADKLGRAFFSDGIKDTLGELKVYDHISLFDRLSIYLKNESYYYKNYAIPIFVYTTDSEEEFEDKYNLLNLSSNEIGLFIVENNPNLKLTLKLGNSLLEMSRFTTASKLKNFSKIISINEIKSKDISSKWLIDLFEFEKKPLLDPLNVMSKKDYQKYDNPILCDDEKKNPTKKINSKANTDGVDFVLGLFFDGTGNNRYNTELIYNQCLKDPIKNTKEPNLVRTFRELDFEKLGNLKFINQPNYPYRKISVKKHMKDLAGGTSYLNPYSNIVLLHDLYQTKAYKNFSIVKDEIVIKQYVQGIGTKVVLDDNGVPTDQYEEDDILGSASGRGKRGVIARVEEGIVNSINQIKKILDDNKINIKSLKIDVFGFSRGATAARHFVNEILKPKEKGYIIRTNVVDGTLGSTIEGQVNVEIPETPKAGYLGKFMESLNIEVPDDIQIRFLGLFDTVVTDAIKRGYWTRNFIELPEKFSNPENVLYERMYGYKNINTSLKNFQGEVCHIIAMDEYRENFPLTVTDAPNRYNLYLYGTHSDIGGGYAEMDYETTLEAADIKNNNDYAALDKVADSYRRRFAYQKVGGKWAFKQGQISLVKRRSHLKPARNKYQPQEKDSDHYEIVDKRFISNKISLVSLNAMLHYAISKKVPFQKDYEKANVPVEEFYELPQLKYFENYYNAVMKIVKDPALNKHHPPLEEYFALFQNYVHMSSNYNKAIGIDGEAGHASEILFVNHPTKDKKRVYLQPSEKD